MRRLFLMLSASLALSACERLGIPDPARQAAEKEQEGKAIGGACRHSGRALEDCFVLNPSANKAAVFTGWKDMNDYMIENKLETVRPELPSAILATKRSHASDQQASEPDSAQSAPEEEEPQSRPSRRRSRLSSDR